MSAPAAVGPADVLRSGLCIGCGACVADVPDAHMALDGYGLLQPRGPDAWMRTPTDGFASTCPFSPGAADEDAISAAAFAGAPHHHPATGRFVAAYVGAVAEGEYRANGSSGGMVTWTLVELLRAGLVDGVAHVVPRPPTGDGRFFEYRVSRTEAAVREGAKSRYHPVELAGVLREVRAVPGRYAVVGVPCFVKAVQLLRRRDPVLRERITCTVALFCGHMKSARFVESFAWQLGTDVDEVAAVEFRRKDPARPASTYTAELTLRDGERRARDWWNLVDGDWGAGFFQAGACSWCDDVTGETADVSFGDAWVAPYSEDGRGTNVVVVRSPSVAALVERAVEDGRLALEPVDGDFVEATQAAGLRQRREGLAYRLTWHRPGLRVRKRVPATSAIPRRRKLVYRMRWLISTWSHRVFWLARRLRRPGVYVRWARAAVTTYHALAYSRGRLGALVERIGRREQTR